jgi:hypothetical protein
MQYQESIVQHGRFFFAGDRYGRRDVHGRTCNSGLRQIKSQERDDDQEVELGQNAGGGNQIRRVRVVGISNHLVRVCTLDPLEPRYASLPRFVFNMKLPYGKSFSITRRQFPLRLAYSLTINRSQGQTLDRVVVDLTTHCFMHGHLNVALSRIRNANNIAVYIKASDYDEYNDVVITTNVVYPEIIAALQIN